MRSITAFITGASRPGFPEIINSLKQSTKYKIKLIAGDSIKTTSAVMGADQFVSIPNGSNTEYASELNEICIDSGVDVLFILHDDQLLPICENLSLFRKNGVEPILPVTDPKLLSIMLDRHRLYQYCEAILDLSVPNIAVDVIDTESVEHSHVIQMLCRKGRLFATFPYSVKFDQSSNKTHYTLELNQKGMSDFTKRFVEGFGLSNCVSVRIQSKEKDDLIVRSVIPTFDCSTGLTLKAGVNLPELVTQMALWEFDYDYTPEIKISIQGFC